MFFGDLDVTVLNSYLILAGTVLDVLLWGGLFLWMLRRVRELTKDLKGRMDAAQAYAAGEAAGKRHADEALAAENARLRVENAEALRLMSELSRRMGESTQTFIEKLKGAGT